MFSSAASRSFSHGPVPLSYPSMDSTAVDFRAFYPYTPNEVKHRKRTTSAQLKILESVFKRDTKPNAALRNDLASQLDMTPRGVQVWFQNRRAKEKTKASKAVAALAATGNSPKNSSGEDPSPSPQLPDQDTVSTPPQSSETVDQLDSASQTSSPTVSNPPPLHLVTDSNNSSWQSSPLRTPDDALSSGQFNDQRDTHFLRRGSLPTGDLFAHADQSALYPPLTGHMDPYARRRSVDASMHRLAANPYAPLARAKNGVMGSRVSGTFIKGRHQTGRPYPTGHGLDAVPQPLHTRHASMDGRNYQLPTTNSASPSPSPLSSYHYTVRASLPDNNLYAFSSRAVGSPLPGPLPSPDFSFGAPSTASSIASPCSPASERNSPDPYLSFRYKGDEYDAEDDRTSISYDAMSRFGSIASIATDSSHTSAFYSDVSGCVPEGLAAERRDSCASGHFLGMLSSLDVNTYREDGAIDGPTSAIDSTAFPSPSSTLSGSSPAVPQSNELNFALQMKPSTDVDGPMAYNQNQNSPATDLKPEAQNHENIPFYFNNGVSQCTPTSMSYSNLVDAPFAHDGTFRGDGQTVGVDSALEYGYSQDIYSAYNPSMDPSLPNNVEFGVSYA